MTTDILETLQDFAKRCTGTYESHIAAVRCGDVVMLAVSALDVEDGGDQEAADVALEACLQLAHSLEGRQALIAEGAVPRLLLCVAKLLLMPVEDADSAAPKAKRLKSCKPTDSCVTPSPVPWVVACEDAEEHVALLAALLLQPQGDARGACASVPAALAQESFRRIQQAWLGVQHSVACGTHVSAALVNDLGGLVALLAVASVQPRESSPSSAAAMSVPIDTLVVSANPTASTGANGRCRPATPVCELVQAPGSSPLPTPPPAVLTAASSLPTAAPWVPTTPPSLLDALLPPAVLLQLLQHHWERGPLHVVHDAPPKSHEAAMCVGDASSPPATMPVACIVRPQQPMPQGLQQWTVRWVLQQLLSACCHCPAVDVTAQDPWKYVCVTHAAKLFSTLPLQGEDVDLVRSQPAAAAGAPQFAEHFCAQGTAVSPRQFLQAYQEGFTVVVRSAGVRCPGLAALQAQLGDALGMSVGANLYLTPPGEQGLTAHYDDHDVLVLQLEGRKQWLLRPPARLGQTLPLTYTARDTVPPIRMEDMGYQELHLCPLDMLYVPRGWHHEAHALPTADNAWEGCPSAIEASLLGRDAINLSREQQDADEQRPKLQEGGASLHVTFGVETEASCCWLSLVHTAVDAATAHVAGQHSAPSCHLVTCQVLLHSWLSHVASSGAPLLRKAVHLSAQAPATVAALESNLACALQQPHIAAVQQAEADSPIMPLALWTSQLDVAFDGWDIRQAAVLALRAVPTLTGAGDQLAPDAPDESDAWLGPASPCGCAFATLPPADRQATTDLLRSCASTSGSSVIPEVVQTLHGCRQTMRSAAVMQAVACQHMASRNRVLETRSVLHHVLSALHFVNSARPAE